MIDCLHTSLVAHAHTHTHTHTHTFSLSLSLSLSIYIYIYIYPYSLVVYLFIYLHNDNNIVLSVIDIVPTVLTHLLFTIQMLTGTYLTINRTDDDGIGTGHAIIPNMAVRPTMLPLTAKYVPQYGSHGQAAAHQHALTASSSSSSYGSPLTTGSNVTASFFAR